MAWTFVNSGGNGASASGSTLTFTIAGVHVHDAIAISVKWESADTTISGGDGSASSFVDAFVGAHVTDGTGFHTMLYCLDSQTSGTVTYTVTWGAGQPFRDTGGMAYTPPSTPSLDGTPHAATGNSTAFNSGNITTTSADGVAFGGYGETGGVPTDSTAQINGVNKDQIVGFGTAGNSRLWSKAYSAAFTGAATLTIAPSNPWGGGIVAMGVFGPVITQQPVQTTVIAGSTANFSITATGTGTVHYQWKKNGANAGSDQNTFSIGPTINGDTLTTVQCIVSDSVGSSNSNVVYLIVIPTATEWLYTA
jgi:hypothetical protein